MSTIMPSVQSSLLCVKVPQGMAPGPLTSSVDRTISESLCSRQFPSVFLEMSTTENSTPATALVMLPRAEGGFHMPHWLFPSSQIPVQWLGGFVAS